MTALTECSGTPCWRDRTGKEITPRKNSDVVGALAVLGYVEALTFLFDGGTQTDD